MEEPQSEPVEEENSSLTIDNSVSDGSNNDDRLITQVTQHLRSIQTQASRDHANAIHESKTEDIEAYAKISAHDWTYYIRSLSINIGRSCEPPVQNQEDKDFVHIDLGPSKTFSRQTAIIYYDSDPGKWFILAKGRNGIKVDAIPFKKTDDPHPLSSGEVIEIGGVEMMFVLPTGISPLRIHPMYLEQAGIKPPRSSPTRETGRTALPTAPSGDHSSSQSTVRPSSSRGQLFQQPIAPAPPDYKRPGTPPQPRAAHHLSAEDACAWILWDCDYEPKRCRSEQGREQAHQTSLQLCPDDNAGYYEHSRGETEPGWYIPIHNQALRLLSSSTTLWLAGEYPNPIPVSRSSPVDWATELDQAQSVAE